MARKMTSTLVGNRFRKTNIDFLQSTSQDRLFALIKKANNMNILIITVQI